MAHSQRLMHALAAAVAVAAVELQRLLRTLASADAAHHGVILAAAVAVALSGAMRAEEAVVCIIDY
jgi:hypothetical protein